MSRISYDADNERVCPECAGTGITEHEGYARPPYGDRPVWRDTCPECDGRGFITLQPVTEEDLP